MMPAYRCMDSCPRQRAPMPSYNYHYPMTGAISPQTMMMDPAGFSVSDGGQPSPMPYHACCGPNCLPYYRTPYAYVPAPFHGHGSYPVYPAVFPYQYDFPLHYPMDGSMFGTDRNAGKKSHCCGCPNLTHSHEADRKLKIEEAESEDGKKEGGPLPIVESLPPDYLKNKGYPYPVLWIPPDYLKNIEHPGNIPKGLMERQLQKDARTSEDHGSVGSDFWKQFFPFDMNKMESLKQGAKSPMQNQESIESNQQIKDWNDGGKDSQLPFPIMFLPSYGRPLTDKTNEFVEAAPKSVENTPSEQKMHPVDFPSLNDISRDSKMHSVSDGKKKIENAVDAEVKAKIKNIPVKQITHGEQTSHKDVKVTEEASGKDMVKDIPVKNKTDKQTKKSSEVTTKKQSASTKNSSKLPPICLRVDPLPRKRNGNGLGKSPISPSNKTDSQESAEAVTSCQNKQIPLQAGSNCVKDLERKRSQEITESTTKDDGEQTLGTLALKPVNAPIQLLENGFVQEGRADKEDRKEENVEYESSEDISKGKDSRLSQGTESENGNRLNLAIKKECEPLFQPIRGKLSEKEPESVIQSAYRGFEVRRSEPLKKLKQIAEVRRQVTDIENQIQMIESSPGIQCSDKKFMEIGETIMSLLLKLDTIQGLHPIIRDIRKSVARQLTNLHGKLDSLTNARTKEQKQSPSVMLGECISVDSCPCKNIGEEEHNEAGNGSCLDGLVRSSPVGSQFPKKAVDLSNCQPDEMVPSTTNEMNTKSSKTGVPTVLDGKVADQQIEAPVVPSACQVAKPETQTNECSLSVDSTAREGEEKSELAAADYLVAVDDKIEDTFVQSPVEVTTEGQVSELELSVPEEKLNNHAEPALPCEPEKTENSEAELEFQNEFAEATYCNGAEADSGVDFVSVEVKPEAPHDVCNEDGDRASPVQEQSEGVQEEPLVPEFDNPLGDVISGVKPVAAKAELESAPSEEYVSGMDEASVDAQDLPNVPPSNGECTDSDKGDITETGLSGGKVGLENEPELAIRTKSEEVVGQGNVQASLLFEDNSHDTSVVTEIMQEWGGIIGDEGFGSNINNHVDSEGGGQMPLKDIGECKDLKSESSFELHGACSELEPRDVDILNKTPVPPAIHVQGGDGGKNSADSGAHSHFQESDKRLIEENEKLRYALEKLIEAGKEQILELSNLNGRVKDLEKKLRKKKPRTRRCARQPPRTSADKLPVAQ